MSRGSNTPVVDKSNMTIHNVIDTLSVNTSPTPKRLPPSLLGVTPSSTTTYCGVKLNLTTYHYM